MEAIITGLTDRFPESFRSRRELLTAGVCGSVFLFALFNVTYGGLYVFTLEDTYFAGTALLFAVTVEVIAISWFYGKILCLLFVSQLQFYFHVITRACSCLL